MNDKTRTTLLATGCAAAFVLLGVVGWQLTHQEKTWQRPQAASITYIAQRGEDLAKISDTHGNVPTLMLAAFNDRALHVGFRERCSSRSWPRPGGGRYFCNPELNLGRASTIVPGQTLRIPDASAVPAEITAVVKGFGSTERLAILVDGTVWSKRQQALDAAVQFNLALDRQHKPLASIWIYDRTGMTEYRDDSMQWPFGRKYPPFQSAVRALETRNIDRFIVVTTGVPKDELKGFRASTPIIGYCLTSECQDPMRQITRKVDNDLKDLAFVVPYKG